MPLPAGCPQEAGSGTIQLQLQYDVDERDSEHMVFMGRTLDVHPVQWK